MKKIAVDIDGVLLDFFGPFVNFYNERNGTNFTVEQITSYDFCKIFCISQEKLDREMDEFYKSLIFKSLPRIDGAKEAIRQLYQKSLLYVVSSRPDKLYEETVIQIRNNFPDYFLKVHLTNGHGTEGLIQKKADVCLRNRYALIIEDSAEEVNECAARGIESILLNRPWNIGENINSTVKRAKDWEEVLQHLT